MPAHGVTVASIGFQYSSSEYSGNRRCHTFTFVADWGILAASIGAVFFLQIHFRALVNIFHFACIEFVSETYRDRFYRGTWLA